MIADDLSFEHPSTTVACRESDGAPAFAPVFVGLTGVEDYLWPGRCAIDLDQNFRDSGVSEMDVLHVDAREHATNVVTLGDGLVPEALLGHLQGEHLVSGESDLQRTYPSVGEWT